MLPLLCAAAVAVASSLPTAATPAAQCSMPLHPAQRTALYDIRNVTVPNVAGCCAACEAESTCRYFEFVIDRQRCWLKTSGGGPKSRDTRCTSGGVTPPPLPPPPPPPPPPGPCSDDWDCSLCGQCKKGKCACDPGFTGDRCEILALGRPMPCGEGGLCMYEHFGPLFHVSCPIP